MKSAAVLLVMLALTTVCGTGCPGVLRPLEPPRADLQTVAATDMSFTAGLTLRLDFAVTNPNAVGLPLRAVDWELELDGRAAARGRVELTATIPAKGSAPVSGTVTIGPGQAVAIAEALSNGDATVFVRGTMHFETSLGDIAAEFQHEQTLSLP